MCGIEILGFRSIAQQSTRAEPSSFLRLGIFVSPLINRRSDDHPSISNGDRFLLSPPPFAVLRSGEIISALLLPSPPPPPRRPSHPLGTRATFGRVSKYARVIGSVKDAADCVGLLKQGLQSCNPWKNTRYTRRYVTITCRYLHRTRHSRIDRDHATNIVYAIGH